MSNQKEILDFLKGFPKRWWSTKEIHRSFEKEIKENLNYKCISRMVHCLYKWRLLERKRDKNEKYGFLYRLI